jgi:hypothetical protein
MVKQHKYCVDALRRGVIMRCLFTHKWVMRREFDFRSRAPDITFAIPHRTCERCGTMQRGTYDTSFRGISWETMRERVYNISEQCGIIRQSSSRLDQLVHSLGLRRSRMSDGTRPERCSALTRVSWPKRYCEPHIPLRRGWANLTHQLERPK